MTSKQQAYFEKWEEEMELKKWEESNGWVGALINAFALTVFIGCWVSMGIMAYQMMTGKY